MNHNTLERANELHTEITKLYRELNTLSNFHYTSADFVLFRGSEKHTTKVSSHLIEHIVSLIKEDIKNKYVKLTEEFDKL